MRVKRQKPEIPDIEELLDDTDSIGDVEPLLLKDETVEFISSGCTTLNLALSGKGKDGGWARNRVLNLVGGGSSGKSLLSLELCFSYYKNVLTTPSKLFPDIKNFQIVYNNVEGVMDFPIRNMYGNKFVDTVQWTRINTIEGFGVDFFNRASQMKKTDSMLYVVDSWDALHSKAELAAFNKSIESGKDEEGSYNMAKQKYASGKFFRKVCDVMEQADITLMIVSQVKDKIGVTFGKKTYRAGGAALNFYTHQVAWLNEVGKLDKTVESEKRIYGVQTRAKVERSKVAKPFREAEFVILFDYGVDDISSMIDYVYGETCKEYSFKDQSFKKKISFIKAIETNNWVEELQAMTFEKWNRIENALKTNRKPRY